MSKYILNTKEAKEIRKNVRALRSVLRSLGIDPDETEKKHKEKRQP